jgi:hypothetical protein
MRKTVSRASPSERIRISGIEFDGLHRNDLSLWPTSRLNTSPIHCGLVRMVADRNRTPLRRSGVTRCWTGERVPPTAGSLAMTAFGHARAKPADGPASDIRRVMPATTFTVAAQTLGCVDSAWCRGAGRKAPARARLQSPPRRHRSFNLGAASAVHGLRRTDVALGECFRGLRTAAADSHLE